jgi:DNA-binding MurR/RpiR family transcriptional regulator
MVEKIQYDSIAEDTYGIRHVTIKDIAKELGISKSTVSRALSHRP